MGSSNWQEREAERLAKGDYKPIPPLDVPIPPHHFPHVSRDDPALIAYTQSPEKGAKDVKTKIKPGTYLKKFFSDRLSAPAIAQYAARFRALNVPDDTTLHFAATPEECVEAYRANTGSCVSYADGGYLGPQHPASVYGSPDDTYVTVAYLKRDGRITAKALVNRKTLKYQSCYGDTTKLAERLNALGYANGGCYCLAGLKLHALPTERKAPDGRTIFIAPPIDGHRYARHDAATASLILVTADEYDKTPKEQRVSLGYNQGLSA